MSLQREEEENSLNTVADHLLGLDQPPAVDEEAAVEAVADTTAPAPPPADAVAPEAHVPQAAPPHLPPGPTNAKARAIAAGQVNRITDDAVLDGMHFTRDSRLALQKATTISLLYLACLADEARKGNKVKRTTLTAQDIHAALRLAGMSHISSQIQTGVKRGRDA